jgi:hypothetical protein
MADTRFYASDVQMPIIDSGKSAGHSPPVYRERYSLCGTSCKRT